VAGGALDLALIGMAGPPPGVDIVLVADEPLVAAVSCDDPLAGRTTTTLAALAKRAIISLPRGSGLRAALDRACAAAGGRLRVAFEATDPQVLAHLASRGLGVAVLPESAAANSRNPLCAVRIAGPELRGQLALAWRTGGPASPAARALITHAQSALQISSPALQSSPQAASG
jgi:DNA-binding transcriptional LysR family regulator